MRGQRPRDSPAAAKVDILWLPTPGGGAVPPWGPQGREGVRPHPQPHRRGSEQGLGPAACRTGGSQAACVRALQDPRLRHVRTRGRLHGAAAHTDHESPPGVQSCAVFLTAVLPLDAVQSAFHHTLCLPTAGGGAGSSTRGPRTAHCSLRWLQARQDPAGRDPRTRTHVPRPRPGWGSAEGRTVSGENDSAL